MERCASAWPDRPEPLEALGKLLFDQNDAPGAEAALTTLIELCPADSAARRNLGVLYLRAGRSDEAVHWLRDSLRLRPGCAATWDELAAALDALGRTEEAREARREADVVRAATAAGPAEETGI
ncbi:MAG: tetratricopeptide repeat protein [Thermoguttaceae bacterium]